MLAATLAAVMQTYRVVAAETPSPSIEMVLLPFDGLESDPKLAAPPVQLTVFWIETDAMAAAFVSVTVIEETGAVPLAALVSSEICSLRDRAVVLVVSGGNVDSHLLGRILNQGLFRSGRILRFAVVLQDVPGALAGLLSVVAALRGNILHILHDRMGRHLPLGLSRVELEVETRDAGHIEELLNGLGSSGYDVEAL